jgi:hypothetical protein
MSPAVPDMHVCFHVDEDARNTHALSVVNRILNDASWINIHCLPVRNDFLSTVCMHYSTYLVMNASMVSEWSRCDPLKVKDNKSIDIRQQRLI